MISLEGELYIHLRMYVYSFRFCAIIGYPRFLAVTEATKIH
ncbi:hypothetical protein BN2364_3902 [Alloalcanivorax xenomutans]|nr:hypothetical protein BN2364_3902 [Alloalcanivorax xenomutans]